MRRVIFSAFILISMLAFCLYTLEHLEYIYTQLTNQIEEIEVLVKNEDYETASEKANAFSQEWHTCEERLLLVVRHSPLDNITVSTAKMVAFVENEERAEALSELMGIKVTLHHMYTSEIPYLRHIF